ncbi:MAG: ATP-binding protein [Desulfobacula sp.]|jgi:PAS domain S-box-containing protein
MATVNFDWESFLDHHRNDIVSEWRDRLKLEVSEQYAGRSPKELTMTTGNACDSFCRMIAGNDYAPINEFINEITRIRLEEGFPLQDVQKAFELYRQIIIPILIRESPPALLCSNIESVNTCLAYTIHRFSYHFQKMHEQYLKDYAEQLEKDVAKRTAELKESEHKYKSLVEDISDGYLVLYRDRIIFINPAFCRMHGYLEKVPTNSFLFFVAEDDREKVRNIITRAIEKEIEPEAFEYLRLTRTGESLHTEINFRPTRFEGQEYNLCIVRDITKRVEMEKKSREIERMAYIGKLTASLSHEIRNPLSSVKMNLQILGKNHNFKGNDKKRLDISEKEIKRLEGILQELLDFAKPVSLQLSGIDLNEIICSCADLLEVKFSKRQIRCDIDVDKTLPCFSADKGKIEQVVINLLLNALDSIEDEGHIRISTKKRNQKEGKYAVIRVEDDGKGISKELLPQIFEPFYTTKTTGTGLGLSNVKQIAAAHGGSVRVVDSKNKGVAFEVFLPLGESNG